MKGTAVPILIATLLREYVVLLVLRTVYVHTVCTVRSTHCVYSTVLVRSTYIRTVSMYEGLRPLYKGTTYRP